MRRRLEELADFLQQLLDSKGGDVTLNTSQLSMDLREGLQRSIKESRMLSCSVLEEQEQASLLEEMDMGGLGEDEDVEQEEWTVPELDLEGGGQEELEALARLQTATQARLGDTESKLSAMEKLLTTPNLSQLKVRSLGGGEREARGRAGRPPPCTWRATRTPGPSRTRRPPGPGWASGRTAACGAADHRDGGHGAAEGERQGGQAAAEGKD